MSISKAMSSLIAVGFLTAFPVVVHAQTDAESRQAAMSKSVVFLEQVIGAWSQVLPKWDSDPTPENWQSALANCSSQMPSSDIKVIGDADPQLPPRQLLVGDLVYYRGKDGLQQFTGPDQELRKFPQLRLGQSSNGTIMYQISNSNDDESVTISISKIPLPNGNAIVMVREQALYLRCPVR